MARPGGGYQVRPVYPPSARRAGAEGTTLLKVYVQANGSIGEVRVERSAGHVALDQAAADAVSKWHFQPARSGPDPVAMWVLIPVEFRIQR
jgi:protein TonB